MISYKRTALCLLLFLLCSVKEMGAQEQNLSLQQKTLNSKDKPSENIKNLVDINSTKGSQNSEISQPENKTAENPVRNQHYSFKVIKNYSEIETLIEQNRLSEAKQLCDKYLSLNPYDTGARLYLAEIYSAQYKLDAAALEYQKILNRYPESAIAHNGMGLIYYRKSASSDMDIRNKQQKYYQQALKHFERAIKNEPYLYKAYNNAGKVYQEMGMPDKALEYYKKAADIEPSYAEAIDNLGVILYAKGYVNEAIAKYQEAIKINSRLSQAYYHLGEALITKGDYSKAINYLQTSLYLNPNSAPVHDMLGKAYQKQGNYAAAIIEYKKSSLIKPEYTYPYIKLSSIYQERGDDELAISELKTVIDIKPDFAEGKIKIADISMKIGKVDQAIKYYKDVLTDNNTSKEALKGLSRAYYIKAQEINTASSNISISDYVDAENYLKEAIKANPDDIQLYLALLRISRLTKNDLEAESYLSKIIESNSNKPIDHIVKGEAYIIYKNYPKAIEEFKQAIESAGNKPEDVIKIGEIFFSNRQYLASEKAFDRVLYLDPGNIKAQRMLAMIGKNKDLALSKLTVAGGFYNMKQYLAAIEALRDCIALNPHLAEAHLLLAKSFEKEKYYYDAMERYNRYISLNKDTDNKKYKEKAAHLQNKIKKLEARGKKPAKYSRI